jgi:hypothetical protein
MKKKGFQEFLGLFQQLMKALYGGTLQAALLFWQDLSGHLEKWRFKLNP